MKRIFNISFILALVLGASSCNMNLRPYSVIDPENALESYADAVKLEYEKDPGASLEELALRNGVVEINVVSSDGIIFASTESDTVHCDRSITVWQFAGDDLATKIGGESVVVKGKLQFSLKAIAVCAEKVVMGCKYALRYIAKQNA